MLERAILTAMIAGALVASLSALDVPALFYENLGSVYAIEPCARDGWGKTTCRAGSVEIP